MNVLSLFAGIGGLDLGLERAGMTVVGQVEIDDFCRRVLERHWPDVPRHDDVRTTVEWWVGGARPAVDVVAGGFPCQPVSLAGRGLAQADERWLWPAMWAVIRDLRPRFAILENVPGLLGRGMGDVLGDLAAIGYDAEWDCIPAAAVGAPHLRYRVFVVAYPRRDGVREQPVAESGRGSMAVAVHDGAARDVADPHGEPRRPLGNAIGRDGGPEVLRRGTPEPRGRRSPLADADGTGLQGHRRPVAGAGELATSASGAASRAGTVADADREREPQPKGAVGEVGRRTGYGGWWSTEPDVGRVAHGVPARVDRLRALGNAVVPQVAEHIGRLVMEAS